MRCKHCGGRLVRDQMGVDQRIYDGAPLHCLACGRAPVPDTASDIHTRLLGALSKEGE